VEIILEENQIHKMYLNSRGAQFIRLIIIIVVIFFSTLSMLIVIECKFIIFVAQYTLHNLSIQILYIYKKRRMGYFWNIKEDEWG